MLAGQSPAGSGAVPASGIRKNVLTNQGVVLLAQAGYSERFIIDMIFHKQTQFDVSVEGLAWLAKQGLSERIVRTMVANERKEEEIAIVPATVAVVPAGSGGDPAPSSTGERKGVNVSIPVNMPTSVSNESSWYVRNAWEGDRWYIVPNIPYFSAGGR
jgi:hypothetical protein